MLPDSCSSGFELVYGEDSKRSFVQDSFEHYLCTVSGLYKKEWGHENASGFDIGNAFAIVSFLPFLCYPHTLTESKIWISVSHRSFGNVMPLVTVYVTYLWRFFPKVDKFQQASSLALDVSVTSFLLLTSTS